MDVLDTYIKAYHELNPKPIEEDKPCCDKPLIVLDTNTDIRHCQNCGQIIEWGYDEPYVRHQHLYSRIAYLRCLLSNLIKNRLIYIDPKLIRLIQTEIKGSITSETIGAAIKKLKLPNIYSLRDIIYCKLTNKKFNITIKEKLRILNLYYQFDKKYYNKKRKKKKPFVNYSIIFRTIFKRIGRPDLCIFVRNINKRSKIERIERIIDKIPLIK